MDIPTKPKPSINLTEHGEISRRLDSLAENQRITYSSIERLTKAIGELKDDYRDFREVYLVKHSEVMENERLNADHIAQHTLEIDEIKKDLKVLNKAVDGLLHSNRILTWLGSSVGLLILSLLFSLLIDKAHIVIP